MTRNISIPLENSIDWVFTLLEQGQVTRYGFIADQPYKQFLPGGIEVPVRHPVKKIDRRQYDLAHRQYLARLKKS